MAPHKINLTKILRIIIIWCNVYNVSGFRLSDVGHITLLTRLWYTYVYVSYRIMFGKIVLNQKCRSTYCFTIINLFKEYTSYARILHLWNKQSSINFLWTFFIFYNITEKKKISNSSTVFLLFFTSGNCWDVDFLSAL